MNAMHEFMKSIVDHTLIKCASIAYYPGDQDPDTVHNLPLDWTILEFAAFLKSLDFEYNNGYGTQHLYGTIWLHDGTWFSRWEYDGSEGWEHHKCPEIKFMPDDIVGTWDGDENDKMMY